MARAKHRLVSTLMGALLTTIGVGAVALTPAQAVQVPSPTPTAPSSDSVTAAHKENYLSQAPKQNIKADSLKIARQGSPSSISITSGGSHATLAKIGHFSVDAGAGKITLAPVPGFSGTVTIGYAAKGRGDNSDVNGTLTFTVSPTLVAVADQVSTDQATAVTFSPAENDLPSAHKDSGASNRSVRLLKSDGTSVKKLVIPGSGTYLVSDDNNVTFTPERRATGPQAPISYVISDSDGNTSRSTVSVTINVAPPTLASDSAHTDQGIDAWVDPLANDRPGRPDAPLRQDSFAFLPAGLPAGSTVSGDGKTVTVAAEGSLTFVKGRVHFTPDPHFLGTTANIGYSITDQLGNTANSTISFSVAAITPIARDDYAVGNPGRAVAVSLLSNDSQGADSVPLRPKSVQLLAPGAASSSNGTSLAVPGQGRYQLRDDGSVQFTPDHAFTGRATPVQYRVADKNGTTASAWVHISLNAPAAPGIVKSTPEGSALSFQSGVMQDSYFLDANGNPTTTLVLPEGTFFVDPSGKVTFTPTPGFHGKAPAVSLFGKNSKGEPISQLIELSAASSAETTAAPAPSAPHGARSTSPAGSAPESYPAPSAFQAVPLALMGAALLAAMALLVIVVRRRKM